MSSDVFDQALGQVRAGGTFVCVALFIFLHTVELREWCILPLSLSPLTVTHSVSELRSCTQRPDLAEVRLLPVGAVAAVMLGSKMLEPRQYLLQTITVCMPGTCIPA